MYLFLLFKLGNNFTWSILMYENVHFSVIYTRKTLRKGIGIKGVPLRSPRVTYLLYRCYSFHKLALLTNLGTARTVLRHLVVEWSFQAF